MEQTKLNSDTAIRSRRIALLGTGLMGQPMGLRLLAAGHQLHVWNRTPAKTSVLVQHGAVLASDPCCALSDGEWQAEWMITMLDSGPIVAEVVEQTIPAWRKGMCVIDMSSTRQSEALELNARCEAHGLAFADAPVSGGVAGAQAGTLAIMVGAHPAVFAELEPVLQAMGRPALVGPPGSGQLAKLCNQLIVGGTIQLVAEALLLAQAGGADPAAVRTALRCGFAESRILELHGQRMLERNFIPGGQVKTQAKDMRNIQAAAADAGLQLPATSLIAQLFAELEAYRATADHSAALIHLERLNPGLRLGDAADRLAE
ncbi:NAD(P)-dependent oxidoreductase [Undibacterium rugosum]|uniref:NAD(P)-dependent oxidoreductase n=1 Tax=Undibacterium rugosum TaxID=2762291 RepID=UPI001B8155AD|nr:NAD(P)-dependent oxidoreductase [Undibacterium rugosum]MBR7777857.1 NAD(P)-dependent oxidoreductase [Undibacterium rugosum]